jgi:hypothetical protein
MPKRKISRDRRVRQGPDHHKLARIWHVLASASDWLHIAEIARRTGINQVTVRWYLDHHMRQALEQAHIVPAIRLRLVKLKPGVQLKDFVKAMELIKDIKREKIQSALSATK